MPPIAMPDPQPQPRPPVIAPAPVLPPPVGTAPPANAQPTPPAPPTTESKPSVQTQAIPRPAGEASPTATDDDGPQLLTGPLPRDPVIQSPANGNARRQPLRS